ncbi:MAG: alkaline phosphatase family protein, partial [Streptosporangiaceae bacterium]
MRLGRVVMASALAVAGTVTVSVSAATHSEAARDRPAVKIDPNIHKIKHIIMIMQENRSFDHYFGTFPGADGIPMKDGVPTVCLPNPHTGQCVKPFHDPRLENAGGPHALKAAQVDVDGGKMDGFVRRAVRPSTLGCPKSNPLCKVNPVKPDVMGWHDAREIPNYWDYAKQFVLQDHMFASNLGWSVPIHLAMVSAWSAKCTNDHDPMTCKSNASLTVSPGTKGKREFPWTDLTWLMRRYHVSWRYYIEAGTQPDCEKDAFTCPPKVQNAETPSIWNPLPKFLDVQQTHQVKNVVDVKHYFKAARDGTLPKVSWVIPSLGNSEHPRASIA